MSETLWFSLNERLEVLYNWRMWCLMRSKISCAYVCLADQCKASTKKSAADWGNCCNRCSGRGIVVPEWGPLKRIQQSAVESQLCAPIGAVCWNDPCKSIRSVFWASEVKHFYTCSGLYTTDVYVKKRLWQNIPLYHVCLWKTTVCCSSAMVVFVLYRHTVLRGSFFFFFWHILFRCRTWLFVTDETLCLLLFHSAGVGRTGTFIVIDSMIDMMHMEQRADVFGFVSRIREQRCQLIQTDVSGDPLRPVVPRTDSWTHLL